MAYYQVLIKLRSSNASMQQVLVDASKKELISRVVQPYKKGNSIFHDSTVINCNDIEKIVIVCTEGKDESERGKLHAESNMRIEELGSQSDSMVIISPGGGYDPEDILEVGTNVTDNYIKGPPGYGRSGALQEFIYNPWVMTIGTGLIIAAVVAWRNWN